MMAIFRADIFRAARNLEPLLALTTQKRAKPQWARLLVCHLLPYGHLELIEGIRERSEFLTGLLYPLIIPLQPWL